MTNGVRNFPGPCDPRGEHGGACFCYEGNGNGYPSPWRFEVTVTTTSPSYAPFIGTWFMDFKERVMPADSCLWELVTFPTRKIELGKVTFDPPAPGPITIAWELRFFLAVPAPTPVAFGSVFVNEPLPALTLPPFTVTGADGTWPDPVILRPVAWDFPAA